MHFNYSRIVFYGRMSQELNCTEALHNSKIHKIVSPYESASILRRQSSNLHLMSSSLHHRNNKTHRTFSSMAIYTTSHFTYNTENHTNCTWNLFLNIRSRFVWKESFFTSFNAQVHWARRLPSRLYLAFYSCIMLILYFFLVNKSL